MGNHLQLWRSRRGLSQTALAQQVGVSRQAIAHLERSGALPNVGLALRLSRALACSVEDLFEDDENLPVVGGRGMDQTRVVLGRVEGRGLARQVDGLGGYRWPVVAAHAIAARSGSGVSLTRLRSGVLSVFLAGCDPALGLLASHIGRGAGSVEGYWWHAANAQALSQLERKEVHVAATHGGLAIPSATVPAVRLRLASWRVGWMLRPANPKGFHSAEDLARPDLSLANREVGAGVRRTLDGLLDEASVAPASVAGYGTLYPDHDAVAEAIALGVADVGIGPEVAARRHGLFFLPITAEASDLWVPRALLGSPEADALFEAAERPSFRLELSAFGPYDTTDTGRRL